MKGILTAGESERRLSLFRWYLVLAAGVALAGVLLFPWRLLRMTVLSPYAEVRGFVAQGNSMCPAVCEHEAVLVGLDAYTKVRPRRGDVVLFQQRDSQVPFIKRIVATEGDTVTFDREHGLLVNGREIAWPSVCGSMDPPADRFADPQQFPQTEAGKDEVFVAGDNLEVSYDSRFAQFGLIPVENIRGKVFAIYMSPKLSRIGCEVK